MEKYYKNSYGRSSNSNLACAAVQDLLDNLDRRDGPKTVAYFTHSGAVLLLLTALRVARDSDTLRADNYYNMQQRKWRVSDITPFASNFMAVKYDCPNEVDPSKVMFFLNEKPIHFNWCKVGLCSLSDVKAHYKDYADAVCSDYYCVNSAKSIRYSNVLIWLISTLITSLVSIQHVA